MVVLNELQSEIGFISQAMQAYVAENSVNQSAAFMELSLFIRFSPPRHAANTPLNSALERHAM